MDLLSDQKMSVLSSIQWNKDQPGERSLSCPEIYSIKEDDIYPFLLDMDPATIKKGVKPSQMLAAFKLTTEECLRKLRSPLRKYKLGTKKDAFKMVPEAIIFLNYETGYNNTTLTIINQSEMSQNLHIYHEPSRFFTLNMDTGMSRLTKIAPGMAVVLNVAFIPTDSYRDYAHKIEISSGDTSFVVPIFALGPRPFTQMPDKLILPPTLVKVESSEIMVLKNNGKTVLNFSNVIPEPFSSNILKAMIPPEGVLEVKFSCYSQKSGTIVGKALCYIRHQFCVEVELECEVKIVNVELDSRIFTFDDIYMGLYSRKVLTLNNRSTYPLNFAWKSMDLEQQQNEITKLTNLMEEMKEYEQQRYEKLKYMDIVDKKGHQAIYERIFHDEQSNLYDERAFLFKSEFFEIIPKVGKIQPNSNFEFSIIFSPKQNIHYYSAAYLDIEGTEKRIRLSLQGSGIGPPVALSVRTVDAGNIYLTDKHQYELTAINKGVVPATVTYKPKKTDWGGILKCIPETLVLGPNSIKALIVVFYSEHQGEFLETLHFEVEESGDLLQFIFKGNVICPLLKCFPEDLDFGTISVGILNSKEITLTNDSRVPINYDFYFEDDFEDKGNKYFNIIPSNGRVLAESSNSIKINFSCDVTAQWKSNLLLIMWKNRMYTTKIPFSCICACPAIICSPKVVSIKFCFLNCYYYRKIKFINSSDLPGRIEYLPDTTCSDNSIECTFSRKKIDFEAHQTIEVEMKIQVRSLGPHQLPLKFLIIGGGPQLLCTINCNGQGPVVSYHPVEIDFGTIYLLKKYTEQLTLVNDSPIIAKIRVYCKGVTPFFIEDDSSNLELLPEEQKQIKICALFNKPGKNKGSINLEIFQGDQTIIKVSGVGVGTSILCEPPLSPILNLGKILTHKNFTQEIRITNKGDMIHKLLFTKQAIVRSFKEIDNDQAPSIFSIVPHYLELDPNQTTSIVLRFSNKKTKDVKEEYFCHALIGKSPQIQTIFHFILEADFVDPHLDISKHHVNFNLNVVDNKTEGNLEETITCENKTGIPLQVAFFLDANNQNFHFFDKNGQKTSKIGQDLHRSLVTLPVYFAPDLGKKRRYSESARLVVEFADHPKIDIINLHGEVMFPTLKLYPNEINFHCVPLGSTSSRNIVMHNTSDMDVYFKWFWIEDSIRIKYITPINVDIVKNIKMADDTIYTTDFMEYVGSYRTELQASKMSVGNGKLHNEIEKCTYDAEKYLKKIKNVLFNVLSPYETPTSDDNFNNFPLKRIPKGRVQKIFSLEPSAGVLKPNEYSAAIIGFTPPLNTEVSATAICQVQGGEEEVLHVIGKSSKLCFKLDRNSVSYGTQVFCELCSGHLTLTNTGICSIDYKVVLEETQYMQAEMLDVQPKGGIINRQESVTFKIDYFPGIPGNFCKSFLLELGYLEPVVINVEGYAVPSQVYLHIPRPHMKQEIEDCYKAISWITPEYLELVKNDVFREICDTPCDPTNFLKSNDWVYVSYNDLYPSLMDIDMAMERIVAFNLINQNPKLLKDHTFSKNIAYIPQFIAPEYLVDFGYVVRDIPVCYTIMIYNYGPIETNVKLIENNKTALLEKEIRLEYNPKTLSVGEMTDLYVIFAPTKRKCLELNKKIEECFHLTVKHGPIITVRIKAVVTMPNVILEHENLYFDNVYCGDALRKTVVLTNSGYIKSKWQASIKKPPKKEDMSRFIVLPDKGTLEPGAKTYLNIYFIPVDTKIIQRSLRIEIDGSPNPVFMELIGQGLEFNLKVIMPELRFTPTLNYFKNIATFTVQNISEIPIEYYFPTLDAVSQREKILTEIYLKYKNLKCVFAPLRSPGNGLPYCFQTTYDSLVDNLRKQICKKNSENVEASDNESRISKSYIEAEDPLVKFSPNELNSMLLDYIAADGFSSHRGKPSTIYELNDSTDRFEILEPSNKKSQEEFQRKAVLFIFHGAPTTEYYKAANQVGIALSIPVYSIDRLIIESLVEEKDPAAFEITDIINESFEDTIDADLDKDLRNSIKEETNEYDKIFGKILNLIAPKPKKSPKKKLGQGSKTPSEKSFRKSRKVGDCFLNITSEALVDLLKAKMKSFPYLIIESLNSTFIPKQNQALYILLRAAGCITYISLVVLSYTVDNYVKNWESAQENIETGGNSEREKDKKKRASKAVLPAEASASGKAGKASTKVDSEKLSKASNVQKDRTKKILLTLNKNLKAELEEFESLRAELIHISQYWDKQNAILKKPFNPGLQKKEGSTKDSARTIRNSSIKKSVSASAIMLGESLFETGIYLCLVLNSTDNRLVDYPKMIRNFVKNNVELQRIVKEIEENEKETFLESETFFTVITNPTSCKNDFSSVFSIRNFKEADVVAPVRSRSKSGSSIVKVKRRRRTSKISRRRSSETKSNNDANSFLRSEYDPEFSARTILFPGDLVKYQVTFCPRKCGIYKYIYTLETVKIGSIGKYQIKCHAVCELPKINWSPEVVFPKILENYREKASYDHFVYIKDRKILDFGSIIAGSSPDKCLLYSTTMSLRNDSSSNCDVYVNLSNEIFSIEPTNFTIAPKSEGVLTISTKSTIIGTQVGQMYISIKNNPHVESIMLACSPCKLEFSVHPRTISFDKVPVSYSAKRAVRLTNTSPLNLRWEFADHGWANGIFELSHESGTIDLYSTCEIVVIFSPTEEISIPKKVLPIKVFDVNSVSSDPCCLESLTIHADSVQYNLDLDGHIDFGDIRGGVISKRLFPITNKEKCEVIIKIQMVNNPLESNNFVREYFKVQPLLITLGSQKTENLSISLHPKCDFSVQNLLVFVVSMVESIQTGHIVKSYKVTMSATAFMPSYTICPLSRVNFGYVPLRNAKKQIMEITNKGKFSFNFNLINYAKLTEKVTETRKGKKAVKDAKVENEKKANSENATKNKSEISKATSKTDKKKQIAISKLQVGSFSISPSSGIVEPNETFTIGVEITPDEVKPYEEKILVNILEIDDTQNQKVVSLKAVGCEPKINLRDFENVFVEQHFAKKIEDFVLPRNVDGCCIFSSSETSLYFKLICIGTSFSTKLYFTNIGHATAQLTAKINESTNQVFSVTPISQTVEPHSRRFVEVKFSLRSLDSITGSLEITYNATADNKLIIPLHGRASLPQIQLLKPFTDSNEAYLELDPICAGYKKEERVSFKNIGEIKCKVILELCPSNDVFSIAPVSSTLPMLNVQDSSRFMVNLSVDDIAEFDVICKPIERKQNQVTLSLHTVHNPYEVNKVSIIADSYDDDIVLEGLEVTVLTPSQDSQGSQTSQESQTSQGSQGTQESQYSLPRRIPTEYHLNLGYKEVNKIYKTIFKIRNRSNKHTYKFVLHSSAVLFIPEIGHLKPRAFKEITAIFESLTPVLLEKAEMSCIITKIEYLYPDEDPTSWDDRLKLACMSSTYDTTSCVCKCSCVPSSESLSLEESSSTLSEDSTVYLGEEEENPELSKDTILEGDEPEINILPDSLEMIPLILTVFADYCRYKCETKLIQFEDTYINEEDIKNVVVENIGNVPLAISWTINNNGCCMSSTSETCIPESTFREEVSTRSASSCELLSNFCIKPEPSLPIVIKPAKIVIEPGSTGVINLHFLPKTEDNFEAILQSNVDSLDPALGKIIIELKGKSLPVPFYFEMEDKTTSSTVASLEFDNIGVATESTRKLFLVNPNDDSISFDITPKDTKDLSPFVCGIARGPITGRTKNFATFHFRAPMLGSFKEEYLVNIPEKNVQKSILLLGLCREPKVYFSQKPIALKATVPNVKSSATAKLCNDEKFPILFRFDKKSLNSENQQEKLEIYPSAGKLQPESEQNIKCTFTTGNTVSASFYIKCIIEKRKSPLRLVVAASSVRLIPLVKYLSKNGEIVILKDDAVNLMDLGSTYKGRKDIIKFEIANTNEIGMIYTWKFDTSHVSHIFNIFTDKQTEFIESNEVSMVNLSFDAVDTGILKHFKISLQIMYGPEYIIHVNAVSQKPSFSFSFNSYNFGYCLKQSKETNYYSTVLIFKNLDVKKILVENIFEKTDFLSVEFTASNVRPGETIQIPIHFFPQTVGSYKTKIAFLLDGIKNMIPISGEAINVNLELCNLKDRFIDFGKVRLGNVKKYHMGVFNNSPAKVDFHLSFYENLFVHERKIEKLDHGGMKIPAVSLPEVGKPKNVLGKDTKAKEEKPVNEKKGRNKKEDLKQAELQVEDLEELEKVKSIKMQEARLEFLKCFVIEPNNFKNVPPKGKRYFNIMFQPNVKMNFEEKIYHEIQDYIKPLFIIKGSSLISEFSLEKKEVSFIGVISGCSSSQLIHVKNTGDLAGSFKWQIDDRRNLFVIEPKEGFVLPKNQIQIKIIFSPTHEKCEFRVKAKCIIKEFKETLTLILKGNSVKMPEPTSTVIMKCNVRERVFESVMVNNNTADKWLLQCNVSNDAFFTPKEIVAVPFNITPITITYCPMKMTTVKPDQADLFIKIPDGSGLLYKLIGQAEPPLLKKRIEKEIRCKQNYHEALPIENWLSVKQTFEVITEVVSPISTKTLYRIFGLKSVDLKGGERKNYNWGAYVVNEGLIEFRVTFKTSEGEYMFFEFSLKVLPSEPKETIVFNTRVREPITMQISLENPVDAIVTYLLESSGKNLKFPKFVKLEPYTMAKIDVTYSPINVETVSTLLTAKCDELGTYTYLVEMKAIVPKMEECVVFVSEFGAKGTQGIVFENTFERTVDFSYHFDDDQFFMEKCGAVTSGDIAKILIAFEPTSLGHCEAKLSLSSPIAGEYIYPLKGESIPPKPKGPFIIKLNNPVTIDFKNPFSEDKQFKLNLSPNALRCDYNEEEIVISKKHVQFVIYVHPETELDASTFLPGKLIVYSSDQPEVQWKYYLELQSQ